MAWHGMAWHGMAWHGMACHGIASRGIFLQLIQTLRLGLCMPVENPCFYLFSKLLNRKAF